MSGILGKKVRMTQIFDDSGQVAPVTIINAGPCFITQIKTNDIDGYEAIQVGYEEIKPKHAKKPQEGHCKKANLKSMRYYREFPKQDTEVALGDEINVDIFSEGEIIEVTGNSKGRGFQGTMKRHGFHGANKTHGQSDRWRAPGSIGQSSSPSRVFKGMKMSGKMGNDQITRKKMPIVKIDKEKNLIFIKGSVPGAPGSLVQIKKKY